MGSRVGSSATDTSVDSEMDEARPTINLDLSKIKENVSYVIYETEGSYFPGLVTKIKKKTFIVKTMRRAEVGYWAWPEAEDVHSCKSKDIIKMIPAPRLTNGRQGYYYVPEIEKYWTFPRL